MNTQEREEWYQVTLSYCCFGIQAIDDRVTKVAPIGRWMIGKDIGRIIRIVEEKGGTCLKIGGVT